MREWQKKLFDDPTVSSMPANFEDFIKEIVKRPEYVKPTLEMVTEVVEGKVTID